MNLEVLISCMYAEDYSIIENSNLSKVNTLVINQCNNNSKVCLNNCHTVYNTTSRGLSKSRNIAIELADADVCLLSDDDEVFVDDLEKIIINAYNDIPDADLIIFKMINKSDRFGGKRKRLSILDLMRVSSCQISFRLEAIKNKIEFDTLVGAGTLNGSGEENKFLLDCYKKKLKIYYEPVEIASVAQEQSTWFHGFNAEYFYNRGKTTRYVYGLIFSIIYCAYFALTKYDIYYKDSSMKEALLYSLKGIYENDINKQKEGLVKDGK